MVQYSRAVEFKYELSGILDRPVEPGDDDSKPPPS
jgi:hypothetical protein